MSDSMSERNGLLMNEILEEDTEERIMMEDYPIEKVN